MKVNTSNISEFSLIYSYKFVLRKAFYCNYFTGTPIISETLFVQWSRNKKISIVFSYF